MGFQGGFGVCSGLPFVISYGRGDKGCEGIAAHGGAREFVSVEIVVGPERAVECEQKFEQVLETKVAEMDINELKHKDVKALIEKGML